MKRLLTSIGLATALLLSGAATDAKAADSSPVFGSAKVQKFDKKQMNAVVGQGSSSAYQAYVGNFYAATAIRYASYGAYLERFNYSGYTSTIESRYYSAYYYAGLARSAYLRAYYYA